MKIKTKDVPQVTDNLIRDNIHAIMKAMGMSMTDLAARLGISVSHLSVYLKENGTSLNTFTWRIINALDIPAKMLLTGPGYDPIIQETINIMRELPEADRMDILERAKDKLELMRYRREKGDNGHNRNAQTFTTLDGSTHTQSENFVKKTRRIR